MHHLKRLPNISLNSELHPVLPLHYRNLFLLIFFFLNHVKKNAITQKNELRNNYRIHRNLISTLMKRNKKNYYSKYFESNVTNNKNTWKGIKSIISMRSSSSITPTLLTFQNETIDNPKRIANILNSYFSTIGEKTQTQKNIHIKITLITSQTKTRIPFSSHQQTKKKLN